MQVYRLPGKRTYMTFIALLDASPNLVVLLHDFEQFDPATIQDIFYIFRLVKNIHYAYTDWLHTSLHIPALPVVFVLSFSSPQSASSYLRATFTRATLCLLSVSSFIFPSGVDLLEELLLKVSKSVSKTTICKRYMSCIFSRHFLTHNSSRISLSDPRRLSFWWTTLIAITCHYLWWLAFSRYLATYSLQQNLTQSCSWSISNISVQTHSLS